jgi:hypothetical protein
MGQPCEFQVEVEGGGTRRLQTRQRPQIVFDGETGRPTTLFNGASFAGDNGDLQDLTHTLAFRFRQKSDDEQPIFQATVWEHGAEGSVCVRIPSLVAAGQRSLLAVAEARYWLGDHCFPDGVDGAAQPNTTALVLRRSTDLGSIPPPRLGTAGPVLPHGPRAHISHRGEPDARMFYVGAR